MVIKNFSKKEAISYGIKITKKYLGVIFSILLILVAFQIISGVLNFGAGSPISKKNIGMIYMEPAVADNFYRHLEETGYINKYGMVQEKLQNISNASDLILPANLEVDRDKIFRFLNLYRYRLPFPRAIFYLLSIALWVVGVIIQIGSVKISIILSRDQKPAIRELFSNGSLFIKFLLGSICCGLAVIGGLILLVIPGIILMIMLAMYSYFIVDKNMGPIESLKASCALTKGVRWQLFCFGVLLILFNLAGFLCLVVGLLFTIPATYIASAYVYDQLLKQDEIAAV